MATHLLGKDFDVAYAYSQLHHPFGHAFWRTVMHLDVDRKGFPYPIVPFHVNCYGSNFVRNRGGPAANRHLALSRTRRVRALGDVSLWVRRLPGLPSRVHIA